MVVSSSASVSSNSTGNINRATLSFNELRDLFNGNLNKQNEKIIASQDSALNRKTVVHLGDKSTTLSDLYGMVLRNTELMGYVVPMIDKIIEKLIECIKDETIKSDIR